MISAGDFKNGLTIEVEGNVYQIVEFLRRLSVRQRSFHRRISREKRCSIYIQMATYIISWMERHSIRLASIRMPSEML